MQIIQEEKRLGYRLRARAGLIFHRNSRSALITGTGRVGTNFLAQVATEVSPKWIALHEPQNDFHDIFQSARVHGVTRAAVDAVHRHRARFWLKAMLSDGFLECNPFLAQCPELIQEGMEHARVAVIVRNWPECVCSFANMAANGAHYFMHDDDYRSRLAAPMLEDMSEEEWNSLNRIEKIAWWWSEINENLLVSAKKNHWYVVRFEDLFGANKNIELNALFRYLGVIDGDEAQMINFDQFPASNSSKQRSFKGRSAQSYTIEVVSECVSHALVKKKLQVVMGLLSGFDESLRAEYG